MAENSRGLTGPGQEALAAARNQLQQVLGVAKGATPVSPTGQDVESESSTDTEPVVPDADHQERDLGEPEPQEPETPEPASEDRIPYDRFQQVNEQRKAAEAELEQLRADLEERESKLKDMTRERALEEVLQGGGRPEEYDEWDLDRQHAWLSKRIARLEAEAVALPQELQGELKRMALEYGVSKTHPDLSRDQVAAVSDVVAEFRAKIQPEEALLLAQSRNPDLFAEGAKADSGSKVEPPSMPASSVSQPPTAGVARGEPTEADRQDHLEDNFRNAATKYDRMRAAAMILSSKLGRSR